MPYTAEFFCSYNSAETIPSDNRAQIAFAGRSNVGKSSLINRLVNQKKLAKTSKTPGRTRLLNFFLIDSRFYFVDLPGYGYAKASKKDRAEFGAMVEGYFRLRKNLEGLILLMDCRREPSDDDLMMIDWLEQNDINYLVALTKSDKLSRNKLFQQQNKIKKRFGIEVIPFSAQTGIGKRELWSWIDETVSRK